MAVINPLAKGDAAASVHGLYDAFTQKFGFMPNIFAATAHRPEALSSFVPFFRLMMSAGTDLVAVAPELWVITFRLKSQ